MTRVETASAQDAAQWNAFVMSVDKAEAYHAYEWRGVFERVFGHDSDYLIARDTTGEVSGVLPLIRLRSRLFGRFLISIPCFNYCGVLAASDEARSKLLAAARTIGENERASHVELRHDGNVELDLPFRDDKVAMRLDLPEHEDELWKGFSSKLRAQIRRPTKEGATCVEGGTELLDDFYRVFSRNMRDLGTPVYPKSLFLEMCRTFPKHTRIFVVKVDEEPCAAGITLGFKDRLEIPNASSLREYNRLSVNMLLYWSVLQYAVRSGYKVFDFGRSSRDSGTYRFKKQWGAKPTQLRWHYVLIDSKAIPRITPANPKYRLATSLWSRLPVGLANMLGPRIVRNLP